eukprot:491848-Amphidinium_carterae.1
MLVTQCIACPTEYLRMILSTAMALLPGTTFLYFVQQHLRSFVLRLLMPGEARQANLPKKMLRQVLNVSNEADTMVNLHLCFRHHRHYHRHHHQ